MLPTQYYVVATLFQSALMLGTQLMDTRIIITLSIGRLMRARVITAQTTSVKEEFLFGDTNAGSAGTERHRYSEVL